MKLARRKTPTSPSDTRAGWKEVGITQAWLRAGTKPGFFEMKVVNAAGETVLCLVTVLDAFKSSHVPRRRLRDSDRPF
jgi:hypothetical protein